MIASGANATRTSETSPAARHSHAKRWRALGWPQAREYLLSILVETAHDRVIRGWKWTEKPILERYGLDAEEWHARLANPNSFLPPQLPVSLGQLLYECGWLCHKMLQVENPDPRYAQLIVPPGTCARDWVMPKISSIFRVEGDLSTIDDPTNPVLQLADFERPRVEGFGLFQLLFPRTAAACLRQLTDSKKNHGHPKATTLTSDHGKRDRAAMALDT